MPPDNVWSYDKNEELVLDNLLNLDRPEIKEYTLQHDFVKDYQAYCDMLSIVPHPQLLKPKVLATTAQAPAEEAAADAATDEEGLGVVEPDLQLNIRNWKIDTASLQLMCLALPSAKTLTSLTFFNAHLSFKQVQILSQQLPTTNVTSLALEWNPLSDDGLPGQIHEGKDSPVDASTIFAEFLNEDSILESLSLRSNALSVNGLLALGKALAKHQLLTKLNLFGNNFGSLGFEKFAPYFARNSSLKHLSISSTGCTGSGALAMIGALTTYPWLPQYNKELEQAKPLIDEITSKNKKAKKVTSAEAIYRQLGLPIAMESSESEEKCGKGNETLEYLNLHASTFSLDEFRQLNEVLEIHHEKLSTHLQTIQLGRMGISEDEIKDVRLSDLVSL